jgi:hypothetical protein
MAYLTPAEYVQYGLTADTTDDWIALASSLIEAYCRRPSLFLAQYVERIRLTPGSQAVTAGPAVANWRIPCWRRSRGPSACPEAGAHWT